MEITTLSVTTKTMFGINRLNYQLRKMSELQDVWTKIDSWVFINTSQTTPFFLNSWRKINIATIIDSMTDKVTEEIPGNT